MKTIKLSLLLIFALTMLSGCNKKVGNTTKYKESFIEGYINTKNLKISNIVSSSSNRQHIEVLLDGELYVAGDPEYAELAAYYGDTEFKREVTPGNYIKSASQEVLDIDIVSATDFNDYPAGTSLRDIVYISFGTFWPYIQSGYSNDIPQTTGISKSLSDITPEELILIGYGLIRLNFTRTPIVREEHTFTITISAHNPLTGEEQTWTGTVQMTVE